MFSVAGCWLLRVATLVATAILGLATSSTLARRADRGLVLLAAARAGLVGKNKVAAAPAKPELAMEA